MSISQFRFHFGVTWDFIFRNSSSFWFSANLLCCLQHLFVGNSYHRAESLEGSWSHLSVTFMAASSPYPKPLQSSKHPATEASQTARSSFGRPNFKATDVWFLAHSPSLPHFPSPCHTLLRSDFSEGSCLYLKYLGTCGQWSLIEQKGHYQHHRFTLNHSSEEKVKSLLALCSVRQVQPSASAPAGLTVFAK